MKHKYYPLPKLIPPKMKAKSLQGFSLAHSWVSKLKVLGMWKKTIDSKKLARFLGLICHCSRVVPNFVLWFSYVEIGFCRDYITQNLFGNITLNYFDENKVYIRCMELVWQYSKSLVLRKRSNRFIRFIMWDLLLLVCGTLLLSYMGLPFGNYNLLTTFGN